MRVLQGEDPGGVGVAAPAGSGRATRLGVPAAFGFAAQAAQVVLARELLVVFYGSEVAVGLVFGLWLFWVALGGIVGGRLGSWRTIPAAAAVQLVLLPATVLLVRDLRSWFDVPAGQYLPLGGLALAAAAVFAPPCLLYGLQFAWAARELRHAGRTYALESAGAALGAAGVALFAPAAGSFLLLATATAAPFATLVAQSRRIAIMGLTAALALGLLSGPIDRAAHERAWRHLGQEKRIVAIRDTPHGPLVAIERGGETSIFRSGRLGPTLPDRGEGAPLACVLLVQHPAPRRLLLAGGSVGLLDEVLCHGVEHVDVVEPDQETFDLLLGLPFPLPGLRDRPEVRRLPGDPRRILREEGEYDLVLIAAGDPDTAAGNRFYTAEFFREVGAHLTAQGVLAVGPLSASTGSASTALLERNATVFRTLRGSFPHVVVTPGSSAWLVASASAPLTLEEAEVAERARKRGRAGLDLARLTERFYVEKTAAEFATGKPFDPLGENAPAEVDGPPNEDGRPLAYFQSTRVWAFLADDALAGFLAAVSSWPAWPWVALACAPALTRRRAGAMFAVGFSAMAASVGVLLAYQARVGSLYGALGLLVAAYMAGSAVGSCLRLPGRVALGLVALVGLGLAGAAGPATLVPVMIAAGFAAGAAYASLADAKNAPSLYAADVAGGCLAAWVVVPLLFPLHGTGALVAAAALPAAVAAILVRAAGPRA